MKKIIFGVGLMICGVLLTLGIYIGEAIYLTSGVSTNGGISPLIGIALFACGIAISIWGMKNEENKK